MKDKTRKAINNVSVVIDMFQSTTEFYKHLESVEVDDLFKMNDMSAKLINLVIVFISNYLLSKFLVFKKNTKT